jgi:predicted 3-demethylubiquinone-9 3-methyltransferase (glyoxalase superfamily)
MAKIQKITPHLWYDKEAKEAAKFYISVFPNSKIKNSVTIHNTPSGDADVIKVQLLGQDFILLNGGPFFKFNEAISLVVECDSQKEIDYYWKKLSADPKVEQCGWLKDKFGLSWQIHPRILSKMLQDKDPTKVEHVTKAFLKMKKFNISELKKAYNKK